jgi:Galactose oxidase, central domain
MTLFLFGPTLEAAGQTAGTFMAVGNMTKARYPTATLLPNGKVLITEVNYSLGQFSSYAELYDPATSTFSATGGTTTVSGIGTLLGNGKGVITGNTAQLYDPVTDNFAPTGSYIGPFYYGPFFYPDTATLLEDGRVLIVGNAAGDGYLEREELYDPVTGTFKLTGKAHTFGFGSDIWWSHTATLLPNGKVLLAGGASEDFGNFSIAELYDPLTDTFTAIANMTTPRAGHTATLLPNRTVLLAGGDPFGSAEVYNPATGTFSSTGNMTTPRAGHTATLLPNGTVLLAGGDPFGSAEVYNPATGTFSSTGNMTTPRVWQAATLLPDGTVLMTGGRSYAGGPLASAELYVPSVLVPVPVVTGLRFDQASVATGSSYLVNFSGSSLTDEMFIDVRFIAPGSNDSVVVLNWQRGLAARHDVPAGTTSGEWAINGVRAHRIETDHTGDFVPVLATITVSP